MAFENVPNIGKVVAEKLTQAGIEDIKDLIMVGSEQAFIRLKTIDPTCCINMLYALEGAVQGIRWHHLEKTRKDELLNFFRTL
jgi:DNA transformation protein